MNLLQGRTAIITGASQGVGQGVARALAAQGANILIAQRGVDSGEAESQYLRDTYGADALFLQTDVTKEDQVNRMIETCLQRFGSLDILVNNAGASRSIRLENHSNEDMRSSFELNYFSVFWAMRAAFPIMRNQGYGRIINMGSLNGVNAHMFTAAYNASKEAMRALSRTAAVEWGPHGITVNVICPAVASPLARSFFESNPELLDAINLQIPVGRMGDAERDIGPAAVFLASEASSYFTGNTMFLSGGSHVNGITWRPDVED